MRRPLPVDLDPKDFPAAKRRRSRVWQGVWALVALAVLVAAALMSGG